jgi:hypothetical protein
MVTRQVLIVQNLLVPLDRRVVGLPGARFGGLLVRRHDLCPELYGSRSPAGLRLPCHGLRTFKRRTHSAAGHVICTNDSYREIAMRRESAKTRASEPIRPNSPGGILTGVPTPISVGSLVATARVTIAVGENPLSGSSDRA